MRSINRTRSLVVGLAVVGTLGLGAYAAAGHDGDTVARGTQAEAPVRQAPTATARERGLVLEGRGTWRGRPVSVTVYENGRYGNTLEMLVGDPDGRHLIATGQGRDAYVVDGILNVGLDLAGETAVVEGRVARKGAARPAPSGDLDGDVVASTGTHAPLEVTATFEYRGEQVELSFPTAFAYDLTVRRAG